MPKLQDVTEIALTLNDSEKAELAEILIQSLGEEEDPEIKSAWIAEVRRRDEDIRSGKIETKPAEQVMREIRERLRCND